MTRPTVLAEDGMGELIELKGRAPAGPVATPELSIWRLIREDVACVRSRDPAARSEVETLLTYPGVHAVIWHRLAHALWRGGWCLPARLLSWLSRFLTNVDIHPGANIGRRFFIDHGAGVVIGETAEIGDDVTLYQGVVLGGVSTEKKKRHPTVGNEVVIGAGAIILGPITIGDCSKVGANSVVLKDVKPYTTVVGVPAREAGKHIIKDHHVDLDHARIIDPIRTVMDDLNKRIKQLEEEVENLRREES